MNENSENSVETTLRRALEKTKSGKLAWEKGGGKNRFVVDVGNYRLRIESVRARGEHPFKFSIVGKGGSGPEQEAIFSIEADTPLDDAQRKLNQELRELWELGKEQVGPTLKELNKLLDEI